MRRFILASVFVLGGVLHASADTYVFKDIQRPNGHDRSQAVKNADAGTCGWTSDGRILTSEAAMARCMRSHGWAISQYIPDAAGTDDDSATYTDVRAGGNRGDSEVNADGLKCDPNGVMSKTSRAFEQCMLSHGWRFYAYHAPTASPAVTQATESNADREFRINMQNSDDTIARVDDFNQRNAESDALSNSAGDAANAANAAAVANGQ